MKGRLFLALRVVLWTGLGAGLVTLALRLDWDQVFGAFSTADLRLLGLAAAVWPLCVALQGLRWAALVNAVQRVPWRTPVAAMYVGQAGSAILPMRAGEAVRLELLSRATGMGRAAALGTVASDHTVNALVMFAFATLLPLLLPLPHWMAASVWGGLAAVLSAVVILLRLAQSPRAAAEGRLAKLVERTRSGLVGLRNPRALGRAAAFSVLAWLGEVVVAMLALAAFQLPHDLSHAAAVLFGVNMALGIPAPPGAMGSFELGAGSALVFFGCEPGRAAAFALGYHALQLIPTLLMGAVMLRMFRSRPELADSSRPESPGARAA